jgi:hypothetical protein
MERKAEVMKQMPFILLVLGAVALLGLNHEYQAIKARLAITQAKIDALADETNATVEILGAAINDLRELFAKLSSDDKPSLDQYKPTIKPRIVMHSGEGCAPCEKWKKEAKQVWEDIGWQVDVVEETQSTRFWPWFEVYDTDGKYFEVDGPLTRDSFEKAKQLK